jgi:hypothetical protein
MTEEKDILKILDFVARHDLHDSIWWRCDGEYAPITIWVNCNDLFYWACADLEELTIDNLPVLAQAIADAREVDSVLGALRGCSLFCCRMRGMRPQQPAYPKENSYTVGGVKTVIPAEDWKALFDACGPERDPKDEG